MARRSCAARRSAGYSRSRARPRSRRSCAGVGAGWTPRRGHVEFIRLIRSDRILHVLGRDLVLGGAFVHEYVTAVLDVREETLTVYHRGRRVTVRRFRIEE